MGHAGAKEDTAPNELWGFFYLMAEKLFHVASLVSNSMVTLQHTQDEQCHQERQGPVHYDRKICFLYVEQGWKLYGLLVCPEFYNSSKITWHHHER